jgi:hypothetical protein
MEADFFMKALSIQQPWAWCIVNGYKPVENRSWPTKYTGLFAIHAGKKFDHEGYNWIRQVFPEIPMPAPAEFERGGIVGQAILISCVTELASPWFFGEYGFLMKEQKPLPYIRCPGQLKFFDVELEGLCQQK